MPAEVSHEEWVRRSRHQKAIIGRQRLELIQVRSDLRSILKRVDDALANRRTDQKQETDQ